MMVLVAWLAVCGTAAATGGDRLDRFRELAASGLARAQLGGAETADATVSELYALVDEEIVENLESGGPFASLGFIQERLDAFGGAWGGASFHILRPAGGAARAPLTIGVLALAGVPGSGSMRLYGRTAGAVVPVRTVTHDGVPEVHEWPAARDGAPQWVVTWTGPAVGRGARPVRVELWRQRRDDEATRVWGSADLYPDGLWASDLAIRRGEIRLRYELRYPGWKPGCEGQTEHEDFYRVPPGADVPALARRQVFNGWHRDLGTAVERFFAALAHQDLRRLAELVPDARVRARLPAGLRPEPACEAHSPDTPGMVVVAATDDGPGPDSRRGESRPATSRVPAASPWSLWWTRAPGGAWRLSAAQPVLE